MTMKFKKGSNLRNYTCRASKGAAEFMCNCARIDPLTMRNGVRQTPKKR
jgi:hypothetical protein